MGKVNKNCPSYIGGECTTSPAPYTELCKNLTCKWQNKKVFEEEKKKIYGGKMTIKAKRIGLYKKAWEKWGATSQCVVAMEECSELIKELSKAIRGKANGVHIAEEIADVEIMLEQIKLHFSIGEMVGKIKDEKINRLEKRLNE